jgi:hypothetical protein
MERKGKAWHGMEIQDKERLDMAKSHMTMPPIIVEHNVLQNHPLV